MTSRRDRLFGAIFKGPKISRIERHVDTRQGNGSKASLQLNVAFSLQLLLSLFVARLDYVVEHLLHFLSPK